MDVGRAFRYVFRDPRWPATMAVAALLLVVPVLGWILLSGYGLRIVRSVVAGTDVPLPAWTEWGGLVADGLKAMLVVAFSLLPTAVALLPRFVVEGENGTALLLPLLALALNLLAAVVVAAAVARVAMTGSFLAGIEGGPVLRLVGRNVGDYVLIFLIVVLIGTLVGCVGGVVFVFVWGAALAAESAGALRGVLAASVLAGVVGFPYLLFVFCHLYGQAYYRAEPTAWRRPLD